MSDSVLELDRLYIDEANASVFVGSLSDRFQRVTEIIAA